MSNTLSSNFSVRFYSLLVLPLTLYVAVMQFTYGKLRHCYVES